MATAFAALVSLQNNLTLIQNHPRHSFSFENEQIESLLSFVRYFIELMNSFDTADGTVKEALERRIARATNAAEDVIESHVVDQIRAGSTLAGKRTSRFLLDLQKVIHGMDCVKIKIDIVITKGFKAEQPTISATTSSTHMASEKNNKLVGFDDLLLGLLDRLTGIPSSRQVIPIMGMGGIGKTTLATNAFQHSYVVQYFDVCLWATVSQEFSVQKILTQLLSQIKEKTSFLFEISSSATSVDKLGEALYKSLFGRRYLIVLDDMWSAEVWDEMKFFFPDTSNGSRIVLTTRQAGLASDLGSMGLNLWFLDEDNSWNLFCEKTFGDEGCPPELEDVGKKIVKNCGGLPLSIVVVGGWLRNSSRTAEYWEIVANDMNSVLDSEANEQCLKILSLSYKYLPARLKPCFLYLGVFPKDEVISAGELARLWIGEGFIIQHENLRLEDVAFAIVIGLLGRFLISACESGLDRYNLKFRVHDVVREMCLKMAVKDEFLSVVNTGRAINRERRVIMKGEFSHAAPRSAHLVRSLMLEAGELSLALRLLRVLKAIGTTFANEITCHLVNLRYLRCCVVGMSLPSSMSLLWNLQTIIVTGGVYGLVIAPYEIWEMPQLRHIEVRPLFILPDPLPIDGLDLVLENLHTLSNVADFSLSDEACRRIPNVLELQVSYFDEPSSSYCPHNLGSFQKLELLECYFDGNAKWRDYACSLTFPKTLVQLSLHGCRLGWEDVTTKVGALPNLTVLTLDHNSVCGSEWNPVEGGFPRLRYLNIHNCDLIHWNADNSHFPVLKDVSLGGLSELAKFPPGVGEIPTLSKVFLADCSLSSIFWAMRMVVDQEEMGNEELQLFVGFTPAEKTLKETVKQIAEDEGLTSKNIHFDIIE